MKLLFWSVIGTILLLVLPLPAHAGNLEGRVQEVGPHQATLTVSYSAATPEAPGKVPEKFAQQAALLEYQAQQLDKKKKKDLVGKLRAMVRKLRCQREMDFIVRDGDPVTILGINSSPLSSLTLGTSLTMQVSAPGLPQSAPNRVTLLRPAHQVNARAPRGLSAMPHGAKDQNSYYKLTGVVLSTAPLTLGIAGQQLTVDDPHGLGFARRTKLTAGTLRKGQSIRVLTGTNPTTQTQQINKILVYTGAAGIPYDQLRDLE